MRLLLSELYDMQIEALLADDMVEFCRYASGGGEPGDPRRLYPSNITSHHLAWSRSAHYPNSIFASLPECGHCASEIEYERVEDDVYPDGRPFNWPGVRHLLLGCCPLSLPDMHKLLDEDESSVFKMRWTRPQLEEFKRRQLAARFYMCEPIEAEVA